MNHVSYTLSLSCSVLDGSFVATLIEKTVKKKQKKKQYPGYDTTSLYDATIASPMNGVIARIGDPVQHTKGIKALHASCSDGNASLFQTASKLRVESRPKAVFPDFN